MSKQFHALIPAAGASKRMPDNIKQLLPWKHTTLLGNAIEQVRPLVDSIHVVLGAYSNEISRSLPEDVHCTVHPNWEKGMGESIAFGVNRILKTKENANAILILIPDQPLIDTTYLEQLKTKFHSKKEIRIVATKYAENTYGIPAIFHKELFPQIQNLTGDSGAKGIIRSNLPIIAHVEPFGKEIDVDTMEAYERLLKKIDGE